ncbi:MAG: nitrite reductase small subunit NirD [Pseudomonadales bacterium]|nr:nitrite reductase small subunit NirD [Pseudomonadales bacterium]
MSNWTKICSTDDLQPNSGICALVDGKQVAIFYMPKLGEVYAVDNWDPFGKANVLSRGLIGDIGGAPMVASPLYKQHFDLKSGQCLEDEEVKLNTYEIQINNNSVEIRV